MPRIGHFFCAGSCRRNTEAPARTITVLAQRTKRVPGKALFPRLEDRYYNGLFFRRPRRDTNRRLVGGIEGN